MALETRATPISAGGLFGWLHPAAGQQTRLPVLVCPPFGLEYLAGYAGWRSLCERLAGAGHTTLRFDYPGTGNSPGEALDPDRIATWRGSIEAAIEALKSATGMESVILLGMRLGATLAAQVAAQRQDVAGLIALAPVISGRRHARELVVFAQMTGAGDAQDNSICVQGFALGHDTLNDLKALRPTDWPAPTPKGLVLARNEEEADLAALWAFDVAPFEGFEDFSENPTHARAPETAFAKVLAWCAALPPQSLAHAPVPPAPARFSLPQGEEEAVSMGPDGRLFGILTRPAEGVGPLAVVLLNAGRNPASGWGRQSVELARACAARGFACLRIDTNGIGDSPRAPDSPEEVLYAARQQPDVLLAIERVKAEGAKKVFLVGSCSGAYLALQVALASPDVAGVALLNLLRFHWKPGDSLDVVSAQSGFRPTGAYARRALQRETWMRLARGEINVAGIAGALWRRGGGALMRPFRRLADRLGLLHSPQREALGWFRALAERQIQVLVINADEDPSLVELSGYFGPNGRALSAFEHLERHLVPGVDHNLSQPDGRARVHSLILDAMARLTPR